MLDICYEIFIRIQKRLTKLPGKISISPHLGILGWGFKCSRESLNKCKYMCDVCSQTGVRTDTHTRTHG
jgi:hypothetical protein